MEHQTYWKWLKALTYATFTNPLRVMGVYVLLPEIIGCILGLVFSAWSLLESVFSLLTRIFLFLIFPVSLPIWAISIYFREKEENAELNKQLDDLELEEQ